jgi:O-antigen/teichoic acid export membrane protein
VQKRLAFDVGGVFLRQLYTVTIGLITTIVFARILGASGAGAYAIAVLVPTLLAGLCNMGLGPAAVVLVNAGTVEFGQARATALLLWKIVCLCVAPLAAVLIHAMGPRVFPSVDPNLLLLAFCLFPLVLLNGVFGALLQCVEDFRGMNLVLATTPTLTCLLGIFAVYQYGTFGAVGALLAAHIGTAIVGYSQLERHSTKSAISSRPAVRVFLAYGLRSNAADAIQLINYRADLYFVNFFVGPAAAGLYALAISLCEKLWLVAEAMTAVLFPRFARFAEDSEHLLLATVAIAIAVSVCGAGLLAVAAHFMIAPLFGPEFKDAANAINWLLPGVVVICFGKILTAFLAARGRVAMNLVASALAAFLNVGCNLYLTPRYGIVGAAMATSLGYMALVAVAVAGAAMELRYQRSVRAGRQITCGADPQPDVTL